MLIQPGQSPFNSNTRLFEIDQRSANSIFEIAKGSNK